MSSIPKFLFKRIARQFGPNTVIQKDDNDDDIFIVKIQGKVARWEERATIQRKGRRWIVCPTALTNQSVGL